MALRRGRRRLGPARASFGPTLRGDSASSFRPNKWPSRDSLSRCGSAIPSSFPGSRARLRSPTLSASKPGARRPFSRRSRSSEDSSTPARWWCPGASRRPVSRTRSNTGRAEPAFSYPSSRTITTGRRTTTAASASGCRKLTPWPFSWDRRVTPGRDSPSLPISTSGVRITPSGNRMSGPRPTSAGSCSRGIRLSGRLVDSADRPIAGQTIIAYPLKGRDRHSTTTEADGTFALGPLRPANYLIYGEGQTPYHNWDPDAAAHAQAIRVVHPARVYLKEEASPEPLKLREMPTVRVELRFVDSKGKPTLGSTTMLGGLLPDDPHPPGRAPGPTSLRREGTTSALNAPEREDPWEPTAWHVQDQPDDDGRVVFYAPQGRNMHGCCYRPKTRQRPSSTGLTPMARSCRCRAASGRRRRRPPVNHHRLPGAHRAGFREDGRRRRSGGSLGHGPSHDRGAGLCKSICPAAGRPLSQPEPDARS